MTPKYILSIDQGTTSSRALLVSLKGEIMGMAQQEFSQIYPKAGWVEHDPEEIWKTQEAVIREVMHQNFVQAEQLAGIGITNQRETTVVWEKATGRPIYNAIVWQDKRTANTCEQMQQEGLLKHVRQQTGLVLDAYFSATKLDWILKNVPDAKAKAERGELLFGTVDAWLIWKLTQGKRHVTDQTNASRTMLYNLQKMQWDEELLRYFNIPAAMLPEVLPSVADFGNAVIEGKEVPIYGVAGDQQAALFGQNCLQAGQAKNTYGTGCFLLMHTGSEFKHSENGLITTLAASVDGTPQFALEGSIFIAGAAIQWLRDGLRIIRDAADTQYFAQKATEEVEEVVMVPAFSGLGAPYWDMEARGAIFGLTRGSNSDHLIKATLDALAYQTRDVIEAMQLDAGVQLDSLKVDGGASANDYLMQFQADILGASIERPRSVESTALGVAYLAGLKAGIWDLEALQQLRNIEKTFSPEMADALRTRKYSVWKKAVKRTMGWLKD